MEGCDLSQRQTHGTQRPEPAVEAKIRNGKRCDIDLPKRLWRSAQRMNQRSPNHSRMSNSQHMIATLLILQPTPGAFDQLHNRLAAMRDRGDIG